MIYGRRMLVATPDVPSFDDRSGSRAILADTHAVNERLARTPRARPKPTEIAASRVAYAAAAPELLPRFASVVTCVNGNDHRTRLTTARSF